MSFSKLLYLTSQVLISCCVDLSKDSELPLQMGESFNPIPWSVWNNSHFIDGGTS